MTARGAAAAMRDLAARLFTSDAEPPYSGLAAALPGAADELDSISQQTHQASLVEVSDAAAVLGQMAREASSRESLHDEDAIELAEAFDRACALVESLAQQMDEISLEHQRDAQGVRIQGALPAWARPASNPVPMIEAIASPVAPTAAATDPVHDVAVFDAPQPSESGETAMISEIAPADIVPSVAPMDEQATSDGDAVEQVESCDIAAETDLSASSFAEPNAAAQPDGSTIEHHADADDVTADAMVARSDAVFDVLELDTDAGMQALREGDRQGLDVAPAQTSAPDVVGESAGEDTTMASRDAVEQLEAPANQVGEPAEQSACAAPAEAQPTEVNGDVGQALINAAAQALAAVDAEAPASDAAVVASTPPDDAVDIAALMAQMDAESSTPGSAEPAAATTLSIDHVKSDDASDAVAEPPAVMGEVAASMETAAIASAETNVDVAPAESTGTPVVTDEVQQLIGGEQPACAANDEDAAAWADLDIAATTGTAFESPPMFNPDTASLVPFMADDLRALADRLGAVAAQLASGDASAASTSLPEIAGELSKTSVFFDLHDIARAAKMTAALVANLGASVPLDVAAHRVRVIERLAHRDAESLSPSAATTTGDAATAPGSDASAAGAPTADGSASTASATGALNADTATGELTPEQVAMLLAAEDQASTWGTTPLMLPPDKADLLQFLVTDVKEAAEQITPLISDIGNIAMRPDIGAELVRLAEQMSRTSSSFEFRSLNELLRLLGDIGIGLAEVSEPLIPELVVRLKGVQSLISQHAIALEVAMESTWPLSRLTTRVHRLLDGQGLSASILNWHNGDPERVLELDGVVEGVEPPPSVPAEEDHSDWQRPAATASATGSTTEATESTTTSALSKGADHVRIESSVIDDLLETVGELVQHKGRIQMLVDELRRESPSERVAELWRTTESMDRFLGVLQSGIMGTRLQAMSKLFDRYPRIVRDVARLADKEIDIKIAGGDTLVDKNLLEALSDPLTAILRNIAARLVESKEIRTRRGKPEIATIRLSARHQGSQVVVSIEDDGGGFDRDDTIRQAQAASLLTAEQAASLPDAELFMLLFQPDLAGSPLSRVGPAVSEVLGGSIQVSSSAGCGSRVDLTVPMKSAILSAVIVAAGNSVYTVPLQGVREITRLEPDRRRSVGGQPCLVLREHVIPLLDSRELFADDMSREPTIALIITDGQTEAALAVDRVLSKQEVAIRHIEESELRRGPFSGTSLTQQGEVSLVLDVQRILGGLNAGSSRNRTNSG